MKRHFSVFLLAVVLTNLLASVEARAGGEVPVVCKLDFLKRLSDDKRAAEEKAVAAVFRKDFNNKYAPLWKFNDPGAAALKTWIELSVASDGGYDRKFVVTFHGNGEARPIYLPCIAAGAASVEDTDVCIKLKSELFRQTVCNALVDNKHLPLFLQKCVPISTKGRLVNQVINGVEDAVASLDLPKEILQAWMIEYFRIEGQTPPQNNRHAFRVQRGADHPDGVFGRNFELADSIPSLPVNNNNLDTFLNRVRGFTIVCVFVDCEPMRATTIEGLSNGPTSVNP